MESLKYLLLEMFDKCMDTIESKKLESQSRILPYPVT